MKRISFFLVILLALCFGQGMAATGIALDGVEPLIGNDTIQAGSVLKFHIKYINDSDSGFNITNAFIITSPDGATWTDSAFGNFHGANLGPFGIDTTGLLSKALFPTLYQLRTFSTPSGAPVRADGISPDTVSFAGAGADVGFAFTPHTSVRNFSILIQTKLADSNKTICIDSSMKFPPTNVWKWAVLYGGGSGDAVVPTWSGKKCIFLWNAPNLRPSITNCVTTIDHTHCTAFSYDFNAADPDLDPYTFVLVSGPGTINASSGLWEAPNLATGNYTLVVAAADAGGQGPTCTVNIVASNLGPVIACPGPKTATVGSPAAQDVNATDDCDVLTFSLGANTLDSIVIDPLTGVVTYVPIVTEVPSQTVWVYVTDGDKTDSCQVTFNVQQGAPYQVQIEKVHHAFQGQFYDVDITLNSANTDSGFGLGGFDILVAYDNSALSFQKAFEGDLYNQDTDSIPGCGWEYFTYRFGANGNCNGGCPSGLVRVVGIAETNNGANHPDCGVEVTPITLATLRFLVSNNRTYECAYVPIRFFWIDCTDNTLSSEDGHTLFISSGVFEFDTTVVDYGSIQNINFGFPTYLGAQAICDEGTVKGKPVRAVWFTNGGIDIECADSIDARGDINLNGLAYEIADAVMFTQYFIKGLAAFPPDCPLCIPPTYATQGAIAASDVNADGIPLSVGDLVYLIRVIVGDAAPYDKTNVTSVVFTNNHGTLSVDAEMGAAALVIAGAADVKLLANNMTMISEFDGTNTNVLVYPAFESLNHFQSFSGEFLQVNGNVISKEFGTVNGGVAKVVELPKAYSLNQNYPNPFNPTTTISFALPKAGDYTLTIYNVAGQKVADLSGTANAGIVEREFDATGLASGVYFYKLTAGEFSATKKAVLLK